MDHVKTIKMIKTCKKKERIMKAKKWRYLAKEYPKKYRLKYEGTDLIIEELKYTNIVHTTILSYHEGLFKNRWTLFDHTGEWL